MPSSYNDLDGLLPIGEAAKMVGVSVGTLRRWEREGHITPLRTPTNQRRYRRSDLENLVAAS